MLSRWSVVHYIAASLYKWITVFIGVIAAYATIDLPYVYWLALPLLVLIVISSVLKYCFFRYQILEDAIQIKRGILFKKQLNLKFKRIQNVNIKHPFYFRPLGLVTLKIDGAGSTSEEVSLAALPLSAASAIRQTIQIKKSGLKESEIEALEIGHRSKLGDEGGTESYSVLASGEEKFYTRSFADLVIHGLTNNKAWLILGALAGFLQSTPSSTSDVLGRLQLLVGSLISNQSVAFVVMLFTISVVLAIVVTALLSVLGSIVTYYGFTLYRSDKSLMVHRGLINKQEINMQKSRVQSICFRQGWLDLVLGRANVIYEQITHTGHDVGTVDNSQKILVPSARDHERSELAQQVFSIPDIATLEFHGISKRYFYKYSMFWSLVYVIIMLAGIISGEIKFAALAILWAIHVGFIYMIWRRAGVVLVDDFVIVRQGIIGIDYIIFPAYKLQVVDHVQSILMKRRNLSNIIFHTASRTAKVRYLPTQLVAELVDYCLFLIESNNRSWM